MRLLIAITVLVGLLAGCSLTPGPNHVPIRYYDLGLIHTPPSTCSVRVNFDLVKASPALQGSRMWYRYDDTPYRPYPYARSQWSAAPSVLIKQRLQRILAGPQSEIAPTVNLEIEQLELQVSADGHASGVLLIQAQAVFASGAREIRQFSYAAPAQSSPEGAAKAGAVTVAEFAADLCTWLSDKEMAQPATDQ